VHCPLEPNRFCGPRGTCILLKGALKYGACSEKFSFPLPFSSVAMHRVDVPLDASRLGYYCLAPSQAWSAIFVCFLNGRFSDCSSDGEFANMRCRAAFFAGLFKFQPRKGREFASSVVETLSALFLVDLCDGTARGPTFDPSYFFFLLRGPSSLLCSSLGS